MTHFLKYILPKDLWVFIPRGGFTPEQKVLAVASLLTILVAVISQEGVFRKTFHLFQSPFFKKRGSGILIAKEWIPDFARLRHTHIVGATGTGKTVLCKEILFSDLARGSGAIIIDPKGERYFYESVRNYCRSIGREKDLFLLSATHPKESVRWNPCNLGNISEIQTKIFNSSIYSEPHYAKACEFGLLVAIRTLFEDGKRPFTISDLLHELKKISEEDKNETLKGLFYDLSNLTLGEWGSILCINKDENGKNKELSILDLISKNQILFVDLPTEGKKVQSSRIGRLLTQEIILISGMRKRNPALLTGKPFSVFIDEFDAFATESFSTFLNKGRSSEFMIHLAHQTLSDLNVISREFAGQILGNCNVRFIFRQDDPDDAERWARFIGTRKMIKNTFRTKDGSKTGDASSREVQEFTVSPDQIKSLKVGECVFSMKTEGVTRVVRIPFKKSPQSKPITAQKIQPVLDPSEWGATAQEIMPIQVKNKWNTIPVPVAKKVEKNS